MKCIFFNSLWPNATIWQHRTGSALAQVMAFCQAITWANVDLSLVRSCGIHLREISQEMLKTSILDMSLKMIDSKLQPHLPGAHELIALVCCCENNYVSIHLLAQTSDALYPIKYICFVVFCFTVIIPDANQWFRQYIYPYSSRAASLALGQCYDCSSASEVILKSSSSSTFYFQSAEVAETDVL